MKIATVLLTISITASPTFARQRSNPQPAAASSKAATSVKPTPTVSPAVPTPSPMATSLPDTVPVVNPPDPALESRLIHYSEKEVVRLRTKLRYTTLIILPKAEKILDFSCGDREFWVVEGSDNFAYVKPAKA